MAQTAALMLAQVQAVFFSSASSSPGVGARCRRVMSVNRLAALAAFGADDALAKVKALKTGSELQVYKKGSTQPISAL